MWSSCWMQTFDLDHRFSKKYLQTKNIFASFYWKLYKIKTVDFAQVFIAQMHIHTPKYKTVDLNFRHDWL